MASAREEDADSARCNNASHRRSQDQISEAPRQVVISASRTARVQKGSTMPPDFLPEFALGVAFLGAGASPPPNGSAIAPEGCVPALGAERLGAGAVCLAFV